ncbi:hypothetical protein ABKW28_19235 [Nocardioides sp. 31GB23]|uniref:hypothetical protein n=1 Tax=Nocardioides sp. 31GB23 TaxID=3156065 RepID=UPI0032AEBFA8
MSTIIEHPVATGRSINQALFADWDDMPGFRFAFPPDQADQRVVVLTFDDTLTPEQCVAVRRRLMSANLLDETRRQAVHDARATGALNLLDIVAAWCANDDLPAPIYPEPDPEPDPVPEETP